MADTRKARVLMSEQIRLINECRQSGKTGADRCRENDIAVSTFYNWVSHCRKVAADQIPAANYGHSPVPRPKQDVVPIDIVSDHRCASSRTHTTLLYWTPWMISICCYDRKHLPVCYIAELAKRFTESVRFVELFCLVRYPDRIPVFNQK